MWDVQFKRFVIIGKAQIAQINPNFEGSKPIELGGKLSFEKPVIVLTAPSRVAQEQNLAT